MPYSNTKRKSIPFCLLSFVTFGVYGCVFLSSVDREANRLAIGHEGVSTTKRYWPWYVLGWATLGIAPLVWQVGLAEKIGKLARDAGVDSPRLSGTWFALWRVLGLWILVGPFLAWHRLFSLLNFLESQANHEEEVRQEARKKAQNGEPSILFATMESAEEPSKETPSDPNQKIVAFAHERVESDGSSLPESQAMNSCVSSEEELLKKYANCPEGDYRVRFESGRLVRGFAYKEDALAFAQELADLKGRRVRSLPSFSQPKKPVDKR